MRIVVRHRAVRHPRLRPHRELPGIPGDHQHLWHHSVIRASRPSRGV